MHVSAAFALTNAHIFGAYIIFAASYQVFALGKFPGLKIDRTGAAIIGAVAMVAFRVLPAGGALHSIDFATVVLLFSMMLIVGTLHLAGFFEWTAQVVLHRLKPQYLLPAVIFTCGLLSAFFVNDIVCLVMVPVVLNIARRARLRPLPFLLGVATASNIGSLATITGNPQNMLIGAYSGIGYRDFLFHLAPVSFFGLFLDWAILYWIHRRALRPLPANAEVVASGAAHQASHLAKPLLVALIVVAGFFFGVPPALMAALGVAMLLITRTGDPHKLYAEVDWGLLVFFVGLFVIVGGAENAGITAKLLVFAHHWDLQRLGIFTAAVGVLSNIVSNVPAVMLLKTLPPGFANTHTAWLVLAMASTLAGNLTITGSVANIIVVETAKPSIEISFSDYLRAGVPVTLATMLVGWGWLSWIK